MAPELIMTPAPNDENKKNPVSRENGNSQAASSGGGGVPVNTAEPGSAVLSSERGGAVSSSGTTVSGTLAVGSGQTSGAVSPGVSFSRPSPVNGAEYSGDGREDGTNGDNALKKPNVAVKATIRSDDSEAMPGAQAKKAGTSGVSSPRTHASQGQGENTFPRDETKPGSPSVEKKTNTHANASDDAARDERQRPSFAAQARPDSVRSTTLSAGRSVSGGTGPTGGTGAPAKDEPKKNVFYATAVTPKKTAQAAAPPEKRGRKKATPSLVIRREIHPDKEKEEGANSPPAPEPSASQTREAAVAPPPPPPPPPPLAAGAGNGYGTMNSGIPPTDAAAVTSSSRHGFPMENNDSPALLQHGAKVTARPVSAPPLPPPPPAPPLPERIIPHSISSGNPLPAAFIPPASSAAYEPPLEAPLSELVMNEDYALPGGSLEPSGATRLAPSPAQGMSPAATAGDWNGQQTAEVRPAPESGVGGSAMPGGGGLPSSSLIREESVAFPEWERVESYPQLTPEAGLAAGSSGDASPHAAPKNVPQEPQAAVYAAQVVDYAVQQASQQVSGATEYMLSGDASLTYGGDGVAATPSLAGKQDTQAVAYETGNGGLSATGYTGQEGSLYTGETGVPAGAYAGAPHGAANGCVSGDAPSPASVPGGAEIYAATEYAPPAQTEIAETDGVTGQTGPPASGFRKLVSDARQQSLDDSDGFLPFNMSVYLASKGGEETADGNTIHPETDPPGIPGPPSDSELLALRTLVLSREIALLERLKNRFSDPIGRTREISEVLSEALVLRAAREDETLDRALDPVVNRIFKSSLRRKPQDFANVIFPVMGPAIRRSIAESFRSMVSSFQQSVELALSWRGLRLRLESLRTGKPFSEVVMLHSLVFKVEQIFLIHRDSGLVLNHVVDEGVDSQDADMVSAMLTAIQDFARDCFARGHEGDLESLQFGEHTIIVEQSPYAYIAAVVRGNPPIEYKQTLRKNLELIQVQFLDVLSTFNGDTAPMAGSTYLLEQCLVAHFAEGKPFSIITKVVPILLLLALLGGFAYWRYTSHGELFSAEKAVEVQQQQEKAFLQTMEGYVEQLRKEPGILIFSLREYMEAPWTMTCLKDDLARDPMDILRAAGAAEGDFVVKNVPYVSLEPVIVARRVREKIHPPENVYMEFLEDGTLRLSGTASMDWILRTRQEAQAIPGVKSLDFENLTDPRLEQLLGLKKEVEAITVAFPMGKDVPVDNEARKLEQAVEALAKIEKLAAEMGISAQLTIYGHADTVGDSKRNYEISQARARTVGAMLYSKGSSMPVSLYGMGAEYAKKGWAPEGDPDSRRIELRVHLGRLSSSTPEDLR